ncbi:MAG: glycosyltransferase [Bacteroidales bacterium]|nr:glycosyltransferase [Bacteroidales bacterium]MCB8998739.1 glycosyltransferase [Bacteroidales bacterium]
MKSKISVITVVYNAGKFLERTLISIQSQKFSELEYIVVDGGSKDNTLELIKNYQSIISKWISEPDDGLYSAMNKGLAMASGEYVLFLNAGDEFYNENVLEAVFSSSQTESDVYYGETMIVDEKGREIGMRRLKAPEKLNWKSLIDGMLVCHQSFIVKRNICGNYNLQYKIAADYDWMLNCLKAAKEITNTHLIISRFLDGGINKHNIGIALRERFRIMLKNYNFLLVFFNHFLIGWRFTFSYLKNGRF